MKLLKKSKNWMPNQLPRVLFVCGTDTNVGKTVVTGALAELYRSEGLSVGVYKPVESGCSRIKNKSKKKIVRPDTEFLARCAGIADLSEVNTYAFKEPLAPGIAAQLNKQKISFAKIKSHLEKLTKKYDVVFVEGAGGLLVPVDDLKTNLDLIKYLKTDVLLVARLGLGTINHTLMTHQILSQNKVKVRGVILSQTTERIDESAQLNPTILMKYKLPVWGVMSFVKRKRAPYLISAITPLSKS